MSKSKQKPPQPKKAGTPIKPVGIFTFYPAISVDTFNGKRLRHGCMFMAIHAGEARFTHKDKDVTVDIKSCMDGTTILTAPNGRNCKINIQRFITAAVEAGLLDEVMDFTETNED